MQAPLVRAGDWVNVEETMCVISVTRSPGHHLGDCEVVLNAKRPATHNIVWVDGHWKFGVPGLVLEPAKLVRYRAVLERLGYGIRRGRTT